MKTLPSALATHIEAGTTTLAWALKITRRDGLVVAFTSASDAVTLASVVHNSAPGLRVSSVDLTAGFAVDNLELTTLDDGTTFSRVDVLGGLWRNAAFTLSKYNWASPADGQDVVMAGTIGEVHLMRGSVSAELRSLKQYLQQPIGLVSSQTCRARLGDAKCTKNLTTFTDPNSVASVTSKQVFAGSLSDYSVPGDANYASIVALVHADAAGSGGTAADFGPLARSFAPSGNASVNTNRSKFGAASLHFDGTGDYFSTAYLAAGDMGTANFTVEFWVWHENATNDTLFHGYVGSSGPSNFTSGGWCFYKQSNGGVLFALPALSGNLPAAALSASAWHHIAASRDGSTFRLFVNGVLASTFVDAGSVTSTQPLSIGGGLNSATFGNNSMRGSIDELRVTKGVARYTASFTPPAAPGLNNAPFADSRVYPVDWFADGLITFSSGASNGLSQKIKTSAADGTLTLVRPMITNIAVADTYTAIAGCRRRLAEDCAAKFGNVLNFQGEPHLPGIDSLTKPP